MITWRGGKGTPEGFSLRKKDSKVPVSENAPESSKPTAAEDSAANLMQKHVQQQIARIDEQIRVATEAGADHVVESLETHRREWQSKLDELSNR